MWRKGLNSVKTGSKWAKNTCLSIPNGPGSLLEKRVFDPFLTLFWSQNGPFSRHFGIFHGPKCVTMGSKWAKNTCLSIINGPGSLLEKCVFDPFLTHFLSQNGPFSRHFGIFHGPKRATTGAKRLKNSCLSIPSGLGTTLEKNHFFRPGDPGGPTVGPHFARAGLPRVLLNVRPTPPRGGGGGGWVWQNFRVGGCPTPPPPPGGGWGGTLWGPLGLSSQCHFFLSSVAGSV